MANVFTIRPLLFRTTLMLFTCFFFGGLMLIAGGIVANTEIFISNPWLRYVSIAAGVGLLFAALLSIVQHIRYGKVRQRLGIGADYIGIPSTRWGTDLQKIMISDIVKFEDYSTETNDYPLNFTTAFKKHFGVMPSQFDSKDEFRKFRRLLRDKLSERGFDLP